MGNKKKGWKRFVATLPWAWVISGLAHAALAIWAVEGGWLTPVTPPPPPKPPQIALEEKHEPPPHRKEPIVEPSLPTPLTLPATPVLVPPDVTLQYERPPIEPVAARTPTEPSPRKTRRKKQARHRPSSPATNARNHVAPMAAESAQEEPALEKPEMPLYPDSPPGELVEGLPGGGHRTGPPTVAMTPKDRTALVRQVYRQQRYPAAAVEMGLEGAVVARFRLDREGNPANIEVSGEGADPLFVEEAKRMLQNGGPYPVPVQRRQIEVYTAVACLHPGVSADVRCVTVRSSGSKEVDSHARAVARKRALKGDNLGWFVVEFPVTLTVEQRISKDGQPEQEIVGLEGDKTFQAVVRNNLSSWLSPWTTTGVLVLPVEFRLE